MTAPEFGEAFGDDQRAYHEHTWPSVHNKGSEQDTFIKAHILPFGQNISFSILKNQLNTQFKNQFKNQYSILNSRWERKTSWSRCVACCTRPQRSLLLQTQSPQHH